jgi:hypothetical protein
MAVRLTDQELRKVLARAEEIERAAQQGDNRNIELDAVIGAAEEVGISRHAVEQAMTELLDVPSDLPVIGSLVWARSVDNKFYVAEVVSVSEQAAGVRFLRGSEHQLPLSDLRPCAFAPGERVVVDWPMWGEWTCTVLAYDEEDGRIKVSDNWGSTKTFNIEDVWLSKVRSDPRVARRHIAVKLIGYGVAAGAAIGSIITALLVG